MQTTLYYCSFYNTFWRRDIIFSLSYTILYCHISATYTMSPKRLYPLFLYNPTKRIFISLLHRKSLRSAIYFLFLIQKIFYYRDKSFYVSIILKTKGYVNEGRELVIPAKRGILHLIRSSPAHPHTFQLKKEKTSCGKTESL